MLIDTSVTVLGPARVTKADGGRLRLSRQDGREVQATLAIPYPYKPVAGDLVLVIGQDDDHYVIGVIQGSGALTISAPGDLELCAPRGRISLVSPRGVEIRGGYVALRATKLELIARTVLERVTDCCRWVENTLQVHAGRVRQVVDGEFRVRANRVVQLAEKDVKIDGERIDLG